MKEKPKDAFSELEKINPELAKQCRAALHEAREIERRKKEREQKSEWWEE